MSTAVARREPAEMAEQQDTQVEAIKRILSQQTPPGEIRVRVGRGGMKLKYTDGAYVIRTLNAAFGWDWDFVADSEELLTNNGKPFEVKVRGSLTVRLGGRSITKTQYGCQPIEMLKNGEAPVSIGDAYKGAATDAMKKCASLLGIALDLYDSDYRADKYAKLEPVEAEPEPQPSPQGPSELDLPEVKSNAAKHVVELARKTGMSAAKLAQTIEAKFGMHIAVGHLADYLEFAGDGELRELYRELQPRTGGRR